MAAAILPGLCGCASYPIVDYATDHRLRIDQVEGDGFQHLLVQPAVASQGKRLHIYIEGDGIPWSGNRPSIDPSPRNTLALRLARQDPNDFAYLGRPCYFARITSAQCSPKYWTSHRYSEEVIRSMAAAIARIRQPGHSEIVLIGHSGGGTIAALLDSKVEGIVAVITVAANLDIDAWTKLHHYDPLTGSLNPLRESRNPTIPHLQLVGGTDKTVPATTSRSYSQGQPNVDLIQFDDFGHVCCWEEAWPAILQRISTRLADNATQ